MSACKYKVESGIQLLARLRRKSDIEHFYPHLFESGPKHDEVIEIFSNDNMSCLLVDIISEALIPAKIGGVDVGVLLINTDGNMNYDVLVNVIRKKIISRVANSSKYGENTDMELNDLLLKSLSNFFVLEVYDATQLYTTLQNLESFLVEHSIISLLVFDTLTAFYWSEQGFKITKMDVYLKNLLRMIQKITKDYKITILYTRPEYFNSSKDSIENQEGCSAQPALEHVNYRIQVICNNDEFYELNVRTYSKLIKKTFKIMEGEMKWLEN